MGLTGKAKADYQREYMAKVRSNRDAGLTGKGLTSDGSNTGSNKPGFPDPAKSHPHMPDVVRSWFLSEYGFLPTEHLGPMTLEQYKAAHCMKCGGFYNIGTDNCPRCNVKPTAERLRALQGATKLVDVKG